METWVLVMAVYASSAQPDTYALPVEVGPMPSYQVCMDVAHAVRRAGHGRVVADCTVMVVDDGDSGEPTYYRR